MNSKNIKKISTNFYVHETSKRRQTSFQYNRNNIVLSVALKLNLYDEIMNCISFHIK